MREDEDVAEAMGIDLVRDQADGLRLGAAFAGIGRGDLCHQVSSIYPHSFTAPDLHQRPGLIIVGGMGSMPGVVVGAFVLVGLPEVLREFDEFRCSLRRLAGRRHDAGPTRGAVAGRPRRRELHSVRPKADTPCEHRRGLRPFGRPSHG